jgi:hypothetical protein
VRNHHQQHEPDAGLQELLVELALTLVPRGVTPKAFGDLSRYAFARAAATISKPASGKINHSRVAALTGLTRADVRKLLRKDESMTASRRSQMPIERVVSGWRADRRFVDRQGNPRCLKISGASNSFALLTKLYGGDVPHRAVLDELDRIGAVRRDGKHVVLTLTRAERLRRSLPSLSAVLPVMTGLLVESRKKELLRPRRKSARLKTPQQAP